MLVDGQSSVETGLTNVHGLAFSTLEENPWGIVNGDRARAFDPGHGLELTQDLVRYEPPFRVDGLASLHFGRIRDQNLVPITYDWPGGAHGTLESRQFSLEGYSAADKPVLYFNYFADTEQESSDPATQTPMLDSLRVFVGDETGQWQLMATNNSYPLHELLFSPLYTTDSVQELYDNNTGWRQVRIELDDFAGLDNLQVRIDFATAGEMNVGDPTTVGSDLRVISASRLSDGEIVTIDGIDFEIELGYTLVVPTGAAVSDGDTFRIVNGAVDRTFEFDSTGALSDPAHVPVVFQDAMTPDEVTYAMEQAILAQFGGGFGFRVEVVGNRINLPDADLIELSGGSAVELFGAPGTIGRPLAIDSGMLISEVVDVVQQALADEFAGGVVRGLPDVRQRGADHWARGRRFGPVRPDKPAAGGRLR